MTVGLAMAALSIALGATGATSKAPTRAWSLYDGPGRSAIAARMFADQQWAPAQDREEKSPCVGEICPPRVAVPGYEPKYIRPSRTDLAAAYLSRTNMTFLSSVARGLMTTGLRLEYTPAAMAGPSQAPTRWGTVFLRVRFRVDAENVPVIPR